MIRDNESKKEEILKIWEGEKDEWLTLNQIRNLVGIHIYKAEVLMNELLSEGKVEKDKKGNFKFWRIKQ